MPGEIAEMMLEGVMCEGCGEFFDDGEEPGYPRRCAGCGGNEDEESPLPHHKSPKAIARTIKCTGGCNRKFRAEFDLQAHLRDKHGIIQEKSS